MEKTAPKPRRGQGLDLPQERFADFRKRYRESIDTPNVKPPMQFLLCPVGIVGAGKTTVVKPLAEKLSMVRISGDEIRRLLKENGFNYNQIRSISLPLIEEFIEQGYSVVIDSDCASSQTREKIIELEKKYDIQAVWIHINPPEEFIINKLKNFKHTWLFDSADEAIENYYSRKPLHENLRLPFMCEIDTSRQDLKDQVNDCRKKIEKFLHLYKHRPPEQKRSVRAG